MCVCVRVRHKPALQLAATDNRCVAVMVVDTLTPGQPEVPEEGFAY